MTEDKEDVGYRRPPRSTRFQKGQSGNPNGRPPGRQRKPPGETVLGRKVPIREDGVERHVTAAEAFILHLTKKGLAGDTRAAQAAIREIQAARTARADNGHHGTQGLTVRFVEAGSVNDALEALRMATKLDRYRDTARIALEPWIVQIALNRLGDKRLSPTQQRTVLNATRTPRKVQWPPWWTVTP